MSSVDENVLSYVIRYGEINRLRRAGVTDDYFVDEHRQIWRFLVKGLKDHGALPSLDVVTARYPNFHMNGVKKKDLPHLVTDLRQRKKQKDLLIFLDRIVEKLDHHDQIDEVIAEFQGTLNEISNTSKQPHLVDLFSTKTSNRIMKEMHRRYSGKIVGIPTGIPKFDAICGGLQKQRMPIIIGRTGSSKSWLNLLFVASAVISGHKVILYPLEMTVEETAFRLYSIFSQKIFGQNKALSNFDISSGKMSPYKIKKFLKFCKEQYGGRLIVADVGRLSDTYTIERIEAEVSMVRPDMIWIDYITLMKATGGSKNDGDYVSIRKLSSGVKQISMRQNIVAGCSAQVNREAIKGKMLLPGLEHISFGDSIGQDSDQVFSIAKVKNVLHWRIAKNRLGPEIGHSKIQLDLDKGYFGEISDDEDDD